MAQSSGRYLPRRWGLPQRSITARRRQQGPGSAGGASARRGAVAASEATRGLQLLCSRAEPAPSPRERGQPGGCGQAGGQAGRGRQARAAPEATMLWMDRKAAVGTQPQASYGAGGRGEGSRQGEERSVGATAEATQAGAAVQCRQATACRAHARRLSARRAWRRACSKIRAASRRVSPAPPTSSDTYSPAKPACAEGSRSMRCLARHAGAAASGHKQVGTWAPTAGGAPGHGRSTHPAPPRAAWCRQGTRAARPTPRCGGATTMQAGM